MSVKRLSDEITSKLRSGIAITNIPQCVNELVLNSLDAGANCIAVRLDLTFFKIRVIDNGRGILFKDLDLIGSRYATSKCNTLEDLYSTRTFGHRGEALASIREISQEMTITTRSTEVEPSQTYVKSFRGTASSTTIERAELQRPSSGTTVTVLNFLYNLPVRQGSVRETLDVEIVRRNLEILALVHPQVSFSLYNDTTESYCLRVTKSSSVKSTFGQLYGGNWISHLKTVSGRRDLFTIKGFIATKGHHNRKLQFVYVHRRRIADERLQKTLNEIFERSFEEGGLRNCTFFPVYVLFIDCPRKNYDVGSCPTKTIVQFRHFDVFKELLVEIVNSFVKEHVKNDHFSEITSPLKSVIAEKHEAEIAVNDYKHSLHSMAAKRPHPTRNDCVTPKTQSYVSLNEPPKRPREQTPLEVYKSVSKSCLESVTPTLYLTEKPKVAETRFPICMSPAVTPHTTFLGRLTKQRNRKERTLKAVADLKRFSYQTIKKNLPKIKETSSHRKINDTIEVDSSTVNKSVMLYSKNDANSSEPSFDRPLSKERSETRPSCSPVILPSLTLRCESDKNEFKTDETSTSVSVSKKVTKQSDDDKKSAASRNWIIGLDPDDDGQFYLDPTSGNSYFGNPSRELQSHSATIVSSSCLSLDAVFGEENYHSTSNLPFRPWRPKETEVGARKTEDGDDEPLAHYSLSSLLDNWNNPILGKGDEEQLLSSSKVITFNRLTLPVDSLSAVGSRSYTLSRNVFENLQFVNQLDRKFIICLASYADIPQLTDGSSKSNLLVLFDQHAIHERIRLESFLNDAGFKNDFEGLTADVLNPPLSLNLPMEVVRVAMTYKSHLAKCGVSVSVDNAEESTLNLHSLPSCLIERDVSECKQQRASVLNDLAKKLILELTENLQHGLPIRPTMPKVVLNVLKSQACHGALKFGHRLTAKTCKHLIVKLGKCKLPFQCAHGRPSITVLADLRHVPKSKKVLKPDLHRLNLFMKQKDRKSS